MLRNKPSTASIPEMAALGVPHLVAAAEPGVAVQASGSVTLSGASPHTIAFADLASQSGGNIRAPIDTDYLVIVVGNSSAKLDMSSRTTTEFDVTGGSADDVVAFVIIGRFAGMKR